MLSTKDRLRKYQILSHDVDPYLVYRYQPLERAGHSNIVVSDSALLWYKFNSTELMISTNRSLYEQRTSSNTAALNYCFLLKLIPIPFERTVHILRNIESYSYNNQLKILKIIIH